MGPNDQQPPRIPRSRRSLTPGSSLHEIGRLIQETVTIQLVAVEDDGSMTSFLTDDFAVVIES